MPQPRTDQKRIDPADLEPYRSTIHRLIQIVPDFPKPGIQFYDITSVLSDAEGLKAIIDGMCALCPEDPTMVAGIEARGFVLGSPVALAHTAGFVAIRKKGKLPGQTLGIEYDLEYGSAGIEIPVHAVKPGDQVVVVDDILATGGTADAACRLIEQAGGTVTAVVFLMELLGLGGREKLAGREVRALLSVEVDE